LNVSGLERVVASAKRSLLAHIWRGIDYTVQRWTSPFLVPHEHGKNGFVTATKLGTTNTFFVAATKNFAAAINRFVNRTKHFVVVTKYFRYPYFNK